MKRNAMRITVSISGVLPNLFLSPFPHVYNSPDSVTATLQNQNQKHAMELVQVRKCQCYFYIYVECMRLEEDKRREGKRREGDIREERVK